MNISTVSPPSQALALVSGAQKASTYETTGGLVTAQFASHNLSLIPPIQEGAIIHDNACGSGTVSRALIYSPNLPSDLKIHATDIDSPFLSALQHEVDQHHWPISVTNQKSESLDFADNTFTHSVTNIAIFFTSSSGLDGAREIYRTLQPGGIAVVNCWAHVTWLLPVRAVHEHIRPGKPFPTPVVAWHDGKHIQKVMRDAGFRKEDMRIEKSDAWAVMKRSLLREWAEKSWAYLGGIAGWLEGDQETWDEAVDKLVELLLVQPGTVAEGD
ncbi:S-adenosyl-L-methionine-dependent methyltransferase [Didymella exigua CBS 183.55]|uniref:S-adenosyl-L-methionine-dependent methyltransferase n=1 Tax=Didymella exigua CBS 183.55 TaxID=1150837 RepID=A0A6A5RZW4_9PLEO|nr:S-adenosyl-L-methionine-dependent methyltransferase [Didymella exigua CBS 183.55]KAF1933153.1 S-adenosyl-L-methionine-dependent methyltransferase [Didymella exigua CBS 183.55]